MRKKIIGFMVAGILFLVLGFVSTPASAELSLGVVGGYYSPNFGQVNDDLDEMNDLFEYNSFQSKTSDTWSETSGLWEFREDMDLKLTVTPVILSLLYEFSPFYIGAGVGSFSTKLKVTSEWEEYFVGFLVDSGSWSESDSDSPTGLVLLAGYGFGGEPVFLNLEARYVVGTKAKLEDLDTEVDLSGLQLCLLGGFRF